MVDKWRCLDAVIALKQCKKSMVSNWSCEILSPGEFDSIVARSIDHSIDKYAEHIIVIDIIYFI